MSWKNRPGNWQGKGAPGMTYAQRGMTDAITTYRRANGSQASTVRSRVIRAPKTFPRAHTPSPEARRRANAERRAQ